MPVLHEEAFGFVAPTPQQITDMEACRVAGKIYAETLEKHVPDGPDKTYIMRKLREVAFWANASIVRNPDGSPRS